MRCCWLIAVLFMACVTHVRADGPPNILMLLSDDHSYPFVGCFDNPNVKTPTLDRLAAGGMKFHRFFTVAPQCVPSRAGLMTGRSAVAARMTRFSSPLPRDEIAFPELLREHANYYTGICGRSFHLDGSAKGAEGVIGEVLAKHQMRTFADRVDFLQGGPDHEVAQIFREFLKGKPSGKPFFMWANFSDPHHPWNAPAKYRPDPASLVLPGHWPDLPGMREQFADYCAEVNRIDETIAGVLEVLNEYKVADNTLIVFLGDNGAALPHGKGSLYDPGSNVPLIVYWPGHCAGGRESKTLLSGEDLAPTLLEAAGVKPGAKMSGKSFLPLLKGQEYTPRTHIFVERGPHGTAPVTQSMASSGYDLARAVRSDRYKLIYNCTPWIPYSPVDSAGGAGWTQIKAAFEQGQLSKPLATTYFTTPRPVYELYDLEADPAELNNLSGQADMSDVEQELRAALAEKMIVDFDYLPLPDLMENQGKKKQSKQSAAEGNGRAQQFGKLDTDQNQVLSRAEFGQGRQAADADRWFTARDVDQDGVISREEYLPEAPLRRAKP